MDRKITRSFTVPEQDWMRFTDAAKAHHMTKSEFIDHSCRLQLKVYRSDGLIPSFTDKRLNELINVFSNFQRSTSTNFQLIYNALNRLMSFTHGPEHYMGHDRPINRHRQK